jgi:hypothetical protein
VTVNVTVGEYFGSEDLTAAEAYNQAIVTSSAYSAVKGEAKTYSVPYKYENGNLVATDLVEIYRDAVDDSGATLTGAYLMDNGQDKLDIIEVEDKSYVALDDPGKTPTLSSVALHGSLGVILLTNNTVVTLVVEDAAGFKYIPSTEESREGSYYLAKDFDNRRDTTIAFDSLTNSLLTEVGSNGTDDVALGYSFGEITGSLTGNAFHGLFDGLGHKINYLYVDVHGLLGVYNVYNDGGAELKNVMLDNMQIATICWNGNMEGTKKLSMSPGTGYIALGTVADTSGNTDAANRNRVYIENVILKLGKVHMYTEIVAAKGSGTKLAQTEGKFIFKNSIVEFYTTSGSSDAYLPASKAGNTLLIGAHHGSTVDGRFATLLVLHQALNTYNLVVISKPTSNLRIPVVTGHNNGNANIFVALYANDYDTYVAGQEGAYEIDKGTYKIYATTPSMDGAGGSVYTSTAGWGTIKVDGVTTFHIAASDASNVEWVTRMNTNNQKGTSSTGTPPTVFFKMENMYRYDTFGQYVGENASVQHGNWLVSADGTAVWEPCGISL